MPYQRKQLPSTDIGEPCPLPVELIGLDDATLADLSANLDPDACQALGYAGQGFVFVADPPPAPVIPNEVPMYKVEKILIKQGLLASVEAALAAMEGEAGDLARVDWKRAPNLVRQSPLVQGLGAAIGLTSEQIDALVVAADALP